MTNVSARIRTLSGFLGLFLVVQACGRNPGAIPEGEIRIDGDLPECESCAIQVSSAIVLGEDGPPVGFPSGLIRLESGEYLLATLTRQTELDLYDQAGRHLQTVGGAGAGPGEYRLVKHLLARRGHIEVIDGRMRRRTVLSPQLQFVEWHGIASDPFAIVPLGPDSLIVSGGMAFRADSPAAISVLDPAGNVVRSFGASGLDPRMFDAPLRRSLAISQRGGVWAAPQKEYRLALWNFTGTLEATILRSPTWFPPNEGTRYRRELPPAPQIEAIHEDKDGLLWVVISIADDRWQDQFTDRPADLAFNGDHGRYLDSVVEVLDPEAGKLLASTRIDPYVRGFLSDGGIYGYWLNESFEPRVGVMQLALHR